jgi:hypothetical protein
MSAIILKNPTKEDNQKLNTKQHQRYVERQREPTDIVGTEATAISVIVTSVHHHFPPILALTNNRFRANQFTRCDVVCALAHAIRKSLSTPKRREDYDDSKGQRERTLN